MTHHTDRQTASRDAPPPPPPITVRSTINYRLTGAALFGQPVARQAPRLGWLLSWSTPATVADVRGNRLSHQHGDSCRWTDVVRVVGWAVG